MTDEQKKLLIEASHSLMTAADRLLGAATTRTVDKCEDAYPEPQPEPREVTDAVNFFMRNGMHSNLSRPIIQAVFDAGREAGQDQEAVRATTLGADSIIGNQIAARHERGQDPRGYSQTAADVRYPRPGDPPLEEMHREPERHRADIFLHSRPKRAFMQCSGCGHSFLSGENHDCNSR